MKTASAFVFAGCLAAWLVPGAPALPARDLGSLPCNDLAQVKTVVALDPKVTSDGNGSIRIRAEQGAQITVADQDGFSVSTGNTFWCTIKVKAGGVQQRAYLEMWCEFGGTSRAFSKGLGQILQGDTEWKEVRLPMMINATGDLTLTRALVNVVIEGSGTVWVDQIRFSSEPGLSTTPR